jgi:hypothetical protein
VIDPREGRIVDALRQRGEMTASEMQRLWSPNASYWSEVWWVFKLYLDLIRLERRGVLRSKWGSDPVGKYRVRTYALSGAPPRNPEQNAACPPYKML